MAEDEASSTAVTATPQPMGRPVPWRGRRRVPDPRDAWVHVRCTAAEHAALTAAALQAGLSTGAYVRAAALGSPGLRAARRPAAGREELARILGLLGNYGGNLNQLARAANTSGALPMAAQLDQLAADVRELRAVLMQALGREREPKAARDGD